MTLRRVGTADFTLLRRATTDHTLVKCVKRIPVALRANYGNNLAIKTYIWQRNGCVPCSGPTYHYYGTDPGGFYDLQFNLQGRPAGVTPRQMIDALVAYPARVAVSIQGAMYYFVPYDKYVFGIVQLVSVGTTIAWEAPFSLDSYAFNLVAGLTGTQSYEPRCCPIPPPQSVTVAKDNSRFITHMSPFGHTFPAGSVPALSYESVAPYSAFGLMSGRIYGSFPAQGMTEAQFLALTLATFMACTARSGAQNSLDMAGTLAFSGYDQYVGLLPEFLQLTFDSLTLQSDGSSFFSCVRSIRQDNYSTGFTSTPGCCNTGTNTPEVPYYGSVTGYI